jgi:hypothetical protein
LTVAREPGDLLRDVKSVSFAISADASILRADPIGAKNIVRDHVRQVINAGRLDGDCEFRLDIQVASDRSHPEKIVPIARGRITKLLVIQVVVPLGRAHLVALALRVDEELRVLLNIQYGHLTRLEHTIQANGFSGGEVGGAALSTAPIRAAVVAVLLAPSPACLIDNASAVRANGSIRTIAGVLPALNRA